jgi:hypothetical protein
MRKKLISIFMTALLLITNLAISTTFVQGEEMTSSTLFDKCMEIGKNFIYDYYYSIDMKKDMDITKYINDTDLLQYLDLKHNIMKNRKVRSNCNVSNFSVDASCNDYEVTDNKLVILYNVKVKHQYAGCKEMSESGLQVKLGFENINGLISVTDYFEISDFDISVSLAQGKGIDTSRSLSVNSSGNSSYKLNFGKESIKLLKDTLVKENEFYDKLDSKVELYKRSEGDKLTKQPSVDSNNSVNLLSVSSTSRSNMVTYATTNCTKAAPSSGNSSYAPYYDFYDIAYDCTNFISHCLLAGGAVENHNKWYYDSLSARSPSWSGVNEFHDFIVANTASGPKAEHRSLAYACPTQYVNWESGDVIQLQEAEYNYPGFGHSTLVTGYYYQNSYSTIPMVTSRTGDNWYTKNEVLTEVYPIGSEILDYRLIHITSLT